DRAAAARDDGSRSRLSAWPCARRRGMYPDSSLQALPRRGPGRQSRETRLSVFDELRVAAGASSDELVDLTALVDEHVAPARRMTALIAGWDRLGGGGGPRPRR